MPTAGPLMAAMTGLVTSKIRSVSTPPKSRRGSTDRRIARSPGDISDEAPPSSVSSEAAPAAADPDGSKASAPPTRSAPAQKARPAPVTITARTSGSSSTRSNASIISMHMRTVNAFMCSGRSSVIVATPLLTS